MRQFVTAGLVFGLLFPAASVQAKTLYTANLGVDSGTCGGKTTPCRSITQSITNAAVGDKILVGPGVYGDIDNDGLYTTPGDETCNGSPGDCLIGISKSVAVVSTNGATATLLNGAVTPGGSLVFITADNVQFGDKGKGFTLTTPSPVYELMGEFGYHGVVMAGNHLLGANGRGVTSRGTGNTIRDNVAIGNALEGIRLEAGSDTISGNVSQGNGQGIEFAFASSGNIVTKNIVQGNAGVGIRILASTSNFITSNAIVGNLQAGVQFLFDSTSTLTGNSIYGNGRDGSNCGVENPGLGAIGAAGNFWGAATGPGADPADAACNTGAGSIATTGFLTKPVNVLATPQR